MYGTGQYDRDILTALENILDLLEGLEPVFNQISSFVQTIAENWLPIVGIAALFLVGFSMVKWVIKV